MGIRSRLALGRGHIFPEHLHEQLALFMGVIQGDMGVRPGGNPAFGLIILAAATEFAFAHPHRVGTHVDAVLGKRPASGEFD